MTIHLKIYERVLMRLAIHPIKVTRSWKVGSLNLIKTQLLSVQINLLPILWGVPNLPNLRLKAPFNWLGCPSLPGACCIGEPRLEDDRIWWSIHVGSSLREGEDEDEFVNEFPDVNSSTLLSFVIVMRNKDTFVVWEKSANWEESINRRRMCDGGMIHNFQFQICHWFDRINFMIVSHIRV
jgi:hypothetical protein